MNQYGVKLFTETPRLVFRDGYKEGYSPTSSFGGNDNFFSVYRFFFGLTYR